MNHLLSTPYHERENYTSSFRVFIYEIATFRSMIELLIVEDFFLEKPTDFPMNECHVQRLSPNHTVIL